MAGPLPSRFPPRRSTPETKRWLGGGKLGTLQRVPFSIVTPSLRQLPWLKRCVRSVADQAVECEHLVQDGGTGGELEEWLRGRPSVRLQVEPDRGLYDALNRGFARASGEILAYLNCDEQYLPGTLALVRDYFQAHPEVDLLAGGYLIVAEDGRLLSHHVATPLRRAMILTDHLYDYSCALFFRRRLWERTGPFNADLRTTGDGEWVARALASGARAACLPRYLSTFTLTEDNLGQSPATIREREAMLHENPLWLRLAGPALRRLRHLEKGMRGGYAHSRIEYDWYASEEAETRTHFLCERAEWRYPFLEKSKVER